MSDQNVLKRYELKYLITKPQQEELFQLMGAYMCPDKFGVSTISNVYYDTPDKRLIRRSLEKPYYKEKLRVRSYSVACEDSRVFVELKKKFDGVVYKRRLAVTHSEVEAYLQGNVPLKKESQISRELDYFMAVYPGLEPSAFLAYDRQAFFGREDSAFRMTFDENILLRDCDMSLCSGVYGERILPEDMVLLEVKTAMSIPRWLLSFLSANRIYRTSFSKYGTAYQEFLLPKLLGGSKNVA